MTQPPEDVFHEFFQKLGPEDRKSYKGRRDLTTLPEATRSFLVTMREQFLAALQNDKKFLLPFYFDYVDSDIANALAFGYGGYSFVGITLPLLEEMMTTTKHLCQSDAIVRILNPHHIFDPARPLFETLLRIQLLFVVSHEYAHHVNGDITAQVSGSVFSSEIVDMGETGGLDRQASEVNADSRATHLVLSDLINGGSRPYVVRVLGLDAEPVSTQDEVLFMCFVVAAASFFFVRKSVVLEDISSVYRLTHPPQVARLATLLSFAACWCTQLRPSLEATATEGRLHALTDRVAEAIWEINNLSGWAAQVELLSSGHGAEYLNRLTDSSSQSPPSQSGM